MHTGQLQVFGKQRLRERREKRQQGRGLEQPATERIGNNDVAATRRLDEPGDADGGVST